MANKPAETKRAKISKAQRLTLLEVLGASLILGTCIVLANFLIKYIVFNTKVISAKNEAIADYDQTLRNVGVCEDKDKNGRLNSSELDSCDPNATSVDSVVGSLRYNIYKTMAQNEDLESVARQRDKDGVCYNSDGTVIDFIEKYNRATTPAERETALKSARLCSALRVIPDALPAVKNTEALMASLNQLFIVSDIEPENIAPRDGGGSASSDGVGVIPVTFRLQGSGATVIRVLDNIERSIRDFDITSALVEWTSSGLSLRADANAYYLSGIPTYETDMEVRAKGDGKPRPKSGQTKK